MRKGRNGEKRRKKKEKRKEKNGVFSGHYVIASSLPPERLRPNDDRWNAARSCQFSMERTKKSVYNAQVSVYGTQKSDLPILSSLFLIVFETLGVIVLL